jgi:endonuclease-3
MSQASTKTRIKIFLERLRPLYGKDPIEVHYQTPFQLVAGVILSAQCTDKRVNSVTERFFNYLREPQDFLALPPGRLEELIKPTGFYRNKAKSILGAALGLVERFDGRVPESLEELITLPGFGRKTANVVLSALYHKHEGVVVDTHVIRLSNRLGFTKEKHPVKIEQDLMATTAPKNWYDISHFMILHGRRVCMARKPACHRCVIADICPSNLSQLSPQIAKKKGFPQKKIVLGAPLKPKV